MRRAGHNYRVVEDLSAAQSALTESFPDLVIGEIQPEWVDGLTAFRARLDRAGGRAVPLIFAVGRRELYRTIADVAQSMDDWPGKPLDP